jgi:cholesterol oxidase
MDYDVLVVGSGFGGSVAALRAAEKGYRVGVLEAGRRWNAKDFPTTNWKVRKFLWAPRLGCRGIQRITLLRDVLVLSGAGVGGGSLNYANVLYEPPAEVWEDERWAAELAPHYDTARRMLGATTTPFQTPADEVLRKVAAHFGAEDTYEPTPVGVWFGEDGVDPYFGGAGPLRNGCVRCGGCMVGCRHGAKNTLDLNYLYLAEQLGAEIVPDREATRLRRLDDAWEVDTARPGAWLRRRPQTYRAREVVLAAGVLGTLTLLLRSQVGGPHVGERLRTNSEVILGASAKRTDVDHSRGIAIGSSIKVGDTHLQPVRYPRGSNLMGLFGTVLVDGGGRIPRPLRFAGQIARRPLDFARSLSVRHWSERTVILLAMQARPNELRARLRRGRLTTEKGAQPIPTYIPEANAAARVAAAELHGLPGNALNEVLLGVPMTAHVLGGACVGSVLDEYHRVLTEPGLHVVDGSAVNANLGVNPSLTIAAQAERALSYWPAKGEPDLRPRLLA